ncbi:MAG: protein kinase [Bacteroidetes bacterium]|nr:protein kinase [Bacteroidota bacterium]
MEDLIGKIIDNYRVVSVLGKGGMGIVYKAYDTKLDRYVAIKMLNASAHDKERFIERFKREAKNQAKLSHPNIVAVYGFIEYSNLLGIVMEYVEGESLEKVIDRQGRFNLYDVIYILKQLLLGMGYAHSKGFVHRDIKPSNIILNKEGITKIMDFGISKSLYDNSVTKTGSKIGTVFYMSPEQVKGQEVTNRSDIYSIGCTVYEMIVGQPPFDYTSEYEVMDGHLKKVPTKISEKLTSVPEQVDKIVLKALEKSPLNRYSSCEEMFQDVQELDKHVAKLYTSYFKRTEPKSKKYKIMSISAFAGFTLLLIGLSYFVYTQVNALITSNELDKFKKYSIQQLFSSDEGKFKFSQITKVESGTLQNLNSITIPDNKFAVAVGDSGTILTSQDNATTWKKNSFDRKIALSDICLLANKKVFVVGDSSSIYVGNSNLDSLRLIPIEKGYTFFRIKFLDDKVGFITGNKGLIMKTQNGGINWTKVLTGTNEVLFDIAFFDMKRGIVVGWNGTILTTSDGGNTWTKLNAFPTDNYLKSVDLTDKGYGLIVGGNGTVLWTRNYGDSWNKEEMKMSNGFQKVKFISEDDAIITGSKGIILVSKDKGESWNLVDSQIFSNMNGLAVDPTGRIFIVGINGMIFKIY